MNLPNPDTGGLHQIANARRSESKEIVRSLMLLPQVWHNEVHHAPGFQYAMEFLNYFTRLWRVFQDDHRQYVIEGSIREGQFLETADRIEFGIVPRRIALSKIETHV